MPEDKKLQIKSLEEMIQGVLLAIPREVSARQFYLGLAGKAISDESRNLFVTLAEQEKGHEAELRRIIGELKNDLEELKKQ
jgi:rubrerythrin